MTFAIPVRLIVTAAMLSGSAVWADQGRGRGDSPQAEERRKGEDDGRGKGQGNTYFHQRRYTKLNIPPGHYPPPGECRVWYPGRPPGQQPPPGGCDRLAVDVPRGAWLMRHPERDQEHVHVVVYDERRPGIVQITGRFRIATGVFVDVVVDR